MWILLVDGLIAAPIGCMTCMNVQIVGALLNLSRACGRCAVPVRCDSGLFERSYQGLAWTGTEGQSITP